MRFRLIVAAMIVPPSVAGVAWRHLVAAHPLLTLLLVAFYEMVVFSLGGLSPS